MNRSLYVIFLLAMLALIIAGCTSRQKEVKDEITLAPNLKEIITNDGQAASVSNNITDEISSVGKELDELEKISGNGTG